MYLKGFDISPKKAWYTIHTTLAGIEKDSVGFPTELNLRQPSGKLKAHCTWQLVCNRAIGRAFECTVIIISRTQWYTNLWQSLLTFSCILYIQFFTSYKIISFQHLILLEESSISEVSICVECILDYK